jgi:hypothetical protein
MAAMYGLWYIKNKAVQIENVQKSDQKAN